MQGVDHLVHLGGIVGDPACAIDEDLTIDVNLAATRLIGEVAKGNGIKHFVFASTCSVYGAAEELLTENSALNPLVALRTEQGCFREAIARDGR